MYPDFPYGTASLVWRFLAQSSHLISKWEVFLVMSYLALLLFQWMKKVEFLLREVGYDVNYAMILPFVS